MPSRNQLPLRGTTPSVSAASGMVTAVRLFRKGKRVSELGIWRGSVYHALDVAGLNDVGTAAL
jgi:hypothetical protein